MLCGDGWSNTEPYAIFHGILPEIFHYIDNYVIVVILTTDIAVRR